MSQGLLLSGIPEKVVRDMILLGAGHMVLWNSVLHTASGFCTFGPPQDPLVPKQSSLFLLNYYVLHFYISELKIMQIACDSQEGFQEDMGACKALHETEHAGMLPQRRCVRSQHL